MLTFTLCCRVLNGSYSGDRLQGQESPCMQCQEKKAQVSSNCIRNPGKMHLPLLQPVYDSLPLRKRSPQLDAVTFHFLMERTPYTRSCSGNVTVIISCHDAKHREIEFSGQTPFVVSSSRPVTHLDIRVRPQYKQFIAQTPSNSFIVQLSCLLVLLSTLVFIWCGKTYSRKQRSKKWSLRHHRETPGPISCFSKPINVRQKFVEMTTAADSDSCEPTTFLAHGARHASPRPNCTLLEMSCLGASNFHNTRTCDCPGFG